MNESTLHYIWQYSLYQHFDLKLNDGRSVIIKNKGQLNKNAGPDFLNAQVIIDNTIWAGNIELHINETDWLKHEHQHDENYQNIILHVVYIADAKESLGNFPVLALDKYIDAALLAKIDTLLLSSSPQIACQSFLSNLPEIILHSWQERLYIERIDSKLNAIKSNTTANNIDWEAIFYQLLFRDFGGNVNRDLFQELAQITPISLLNKHKNNLTHIEAILFGQAGLIPQVPTHPYEIELRVHYAFYQHKYQLKPLDVARWKFLRMRPSSFPTVRLALLAQLISSKDHLFSKSLSINNTTELYELYDVQISDFWYSHYTFKKETKVISKSIGTSLKQSILINTIIPIMYMYGKHTANEMLKQKAFQLIQNCPGESNTITKAWQKAGISINNALDSQSLLQLYNNYCLSKKCFSCSIGLWVMKRK